MSGLHAARAAARIRRELRVAVEEVRGRYGDYEVLVDGETIVSGGLAVVIGVMPSTRKIVEKVRERLGGG